MQGCRPCMTSGAMSMKHSFARIGSLAAIATLLLGVPAALALETDSAAPARQIGTSTTSLAQLQTAPARSGTLLDSSQIDEKKPLLHGRLRKASATSQAVNPKATVKKRQMDARFLPQTVTYSGAEAPGTIVIDTGQRFLYLIETGGYARRYGVGVGKQGFGWKGPQRVSRKAEWPTWTPPATMRERERKKGRFLPVSMKGGINNPLGARALYLGSSLFRIHGTNQPWTIGTAASSGCFRMRNEDVTDLYDRVPVGTKVIVR